jgi:hypothetical protein
MGDFQEALAALLGRDAPNLSPSVTARPRGEWEADYWQRRDLSARRYVYVWADGATQRLTRPSKRSGAMTAHAFPRRVSRHPTSGRTGARAC